jgi:hypothetical protein
MLLLRNHEYSSFLVLKVRFPGRGADPRTPKDKYRPFICNCGYGRVAKAGTRLFHMRFSSSIMVGFDKPILEQGERTRGLSRGIHVPVRQSPYSA